MTLATHEEVVDAEIVEDFNVDEVFKPQVVHEVEVYAGPDDTAARTNLRQAGEIEKSSRWTIARLIAASVELSKPGPKSSGPQGPKLGLVEAGEAMGRSKNTIRAYLNAWNAAAADGLCAPSTDLTPADGWTAEMPDPEEWARRSRFAGMLSLLSRMPQRLSLSRARTIARSVFCWRLLLVLMIRNPMRGWSVKSATFSQHPNLHHL